MVYDFEIREVIIKIINVYKMKLLYLHSIEKWESFLTLNNCL